MRRDNREYTIGKGMLLVAVWVGCTSYVRRYVSCTKNYRCDEGIQVSSLSHAQKNSCSLCRAKYPKPGSEAIERLHSWVEKGKKHGRRVAGSKVRKIQWLRLAFCLSTRMSSLQ